MGKRGPAPEPTALKIARGNPGKRPLNTREPEPTKGAPPCPSWLDRAAKAAWRDLVAELSKIGLLTVVDGAALAAFCQAVAEHEWATKRLHRDGRIVTIKRSGYRAPHPAVAMQRSAWKTIKEFAALFGLDPSSRSRLKMPGDAGFTREEDPFDKLLKQRQAQSSG